MIRVRRKMYKTFLLCVMAAILPWSVYAGEIRLSAAASLKDAMTELADQFAVNNPGVTFQKNFGAAGALAKQIENGADSDIFVSANPGWMLYLKDKGFVGEKNIRILAGNSLVFVGKAELNLKHLNDIVTLEKIAVGSPKSVPAGEYAMEAIQKAGIEKALKNKLVMTRDVLECLMYAERGEVDGAFIYQSNTLEMSKRLKILFHVPGDLYSRVIYPMGLTSAGAGKKEARAFFDFLQTEEAKEILINNGFITE